MTRLSVGCALLVALMGLGCDDDGPETDGGSPVVDGGGGGTDGGGGDPDGGSVGDGPSVTASAQTVSVLSVVVVDQVVSEGPGWIVIHEDDGGAIGGIVGFTAVSDGANADVAVELTEARAAVDGETLYAMLHADTGTVGEFEFDGGEIDGPVSDDDGVIAPPFVVTVPEGTPAALITLGNNGASDYFVESVVPSFFAGAASGGTGSINPDPTLILANGVRYAIDNPITGPHPFEITTAGATPAEDVVLLSQSIEGSLEDEAAIDWVEDGDRMIFTADMAALTAATGYRCAIHRSSMRGAVQIVSPL
jgi:hypothetical protein